MDVTKPLIVLSGPITSRGQVSKILANGGYPIAAGDPDHGHGLPDTTEGTEDASIGWLSVHGDDLDYALELINGTDWVIRMHRGPAIASVDAPVYDPEAKISELEARLARLEGN